MKLKTVEPSTKPMQSMVDTLIDAPEGRIEIDYRPMVPILINPDFVYTLEVDDA